MARSPDVHCGPPPLDVIATGQEWLSAKLNNELDVLSNLIYLRSMTRITANTIWRLLNKPLLAFA